MMFERGFLAWGSQNEVHWDTASIALPLGDSWPCSWSQSCCYHCPVGQWVRKCELTEFWDSICRSLFRRYGDITCLAVCCIIAWLPPRPPTRYASEVAAFFYFAATNKLHVLVTRAEVVHVRALVARFPPVVRKVAGSIPASSIYARCVLFSRVRAITVPQRERQFTIARSSFFFTSLRGFSSITPSNRVLPLSKWKSIAQSRDKPNHIQKRLFASIWSPGSTLLCYMRFKNVVHLMGVLYYDRGIVRIWELHSLLTAKSILACHACFNCDISSWFDRFDICALCNWL